MPLIDDANLVDIKSEMIKESYLRGAKSRGFAFGKLGFKLPTDYPEGTLLGDAYRLGYEEGLMALAKKKENEDATPV